MTELELYVCQNCHKPYEDWTILPHKLFNNIYPDGGLFCYDCFMSAQTQALIYKRERLARIKLLDEIKNNEALRPKFISKSVEEIMVKHATDDLGLLVQKAFLAGQAETLALVDSYRFSSALSDKHSSEELTEEQQYAADETEEELSGADKWEG